MALVDLGDDLANAEEPKAVPHGSECHCKIVRLACDESGAYVLTNKSGNQYLRPICEIMNSSDYGIKNPKDFSHYMGFPHDEQSQKQKENALSRIKQLLEACGVDFDGGRFDPEVLIGCEFWAILKMTESDEYGEQNDISKLIAAA